MEFKSKTQSVVSVAAHSEHGAKSGFCSGWWSFGNSASPSELFPESNPFPRFFQIPKLRLVRSGPGNSDQIEPSSTMSAPRNREILEALRVTLQKLESTTDPDRDKDEVAHLRRILLARIADLELREKLTATDEEPRS